MTSLAEKLSHNLNQVQQRIQAAEQRFGRTAGSVNLLAVSKTHSVDKIAALAEAGQSSFGENYVQEALEKIQTLKIQELTWHFIGPIQSNKTQSIAEHFSWVHSVDRLKIAKRLSYQRPHELPPLNICLQVNISREASKSGVLPDELIPLAKQVVPLPRLRLRGLMAIPAPSHDFAKQRQSFHKLGQLQQKLRTAGLTVDTLSMGMSDDLEAAIAEGADWVRIGTAIFGPRE